MSNSRGRPKKNSIEIDRETDKELARIFYDIDRYGFSSFKYPTDKHKKITKRLGMKCSHLVDDNFMLPVISYKTTNKPDLKGRSSIQKRTGVFVDKEIIDPRHIRYKFRRNIL